MCFMISVFLTFRFGDTGRAVERWKRESLAQLESLPCLEPFLPIERALGSTYLHKCFCTTLSIYIGSMCNDYISMWKEIHVLADLVKLFNEFMLLAVVVLK